MATLDDVPLGQPRIRWSEIDETSPDYFKTLAAPSDDDLVIMWSVTALFNVFSSVIVGVVFLAILVSPRVRRKPFNVFLLFLMLPDFLYAFFCMFTCWLSAYAGHYWSSAMCRWQSVYLVFGLSANSWLNFLTCREVYRLLKSSKERQKYEAPKAKTVVMQSLAVYAYSLGLSLLILVRHDWFPHKVDVQYGFACLPVQYDQADQLFFFVFFVPAFVGIPMVYIFYVLFDVFWNNLLPSEGKSRRLTLYFFRLSAIFIIFWAPGVFVYYIMRGVDPWGMFAFGLWIHCQAPVGAISSVYKDDISKAVRAFLMLEKPSSLPVTEKSRIDGRSTDDFPNELPSSDPNTIKKTPEVHDYSEVSESINHHPHIVSQQTELLVPTRTIEKRLIRPYGKKRSAFDKNPSSSLDTCVQKVLCHQDEDIGEEESDLYVAQSSSMTKV